jgi:hypothetical protein
MREGEDTTRYDGIVQEHLFTRDIHVTSITSLRSLIRRGKSFNMSKTKRAVPSACNHFTEAECHVLDAVLGDRWNMGAC